MLSSCRTMHWHVLLSCISLWAGLALAEVGTFDFCRDFFYQQREPRGFMTSDDKAKICQKYHNRYHFATFYDKSNRIPLWSAYHLTDSDDGKKEARRRNDWFVEPQLCDTLENEQMTTEEQSRLTPDELRSCQAVNEDYKYSSYDRGHLNPFSFQSKDSRLATMTLTNAAPMDPCFNQVNWKNLELNLKTQLNKNCNKNGGTSYLVTGTVPSGSEKIPIKEEEEEEERGQTQEYNRVSVPSHIWTAVCCDHTDNNRKFSFAFLAENRVESKLKIIRVEQLNSELSPLYQDSPSIEIFADDCNSESRKGQEVLSEMKSVLYRRFQVLFSEQYSQLLPQRKRNRLDLETALVMGSTNLDQNKVQLTIRFLISFPSLAGWNSFFEKAYQQANLACVLDPAAGADPDREAEASGSSDSICVLQQPRSGVSATGWRCICGHDDETAYSWCSIPSNRNWDYCCTDKCTLNRESNRYECSRGDGHSVACAPKYSTVTVSGEACRANHPCGLYGKRYFWCYTDKLNNWDYCCSPRHYCGNHGNNYQWCYTEDPQKSWQRCTPHVPAQEGPVVHRDLRGLRY